MTAQFRERQSAPPVRIERIFKASEMPDFARLHEMHRPKQSNQELTVPVSFDLLSEKRRLKTLEIREEKQRL